MAHDIFLMKSLRNIEFSCINYFLKKFINSRFLPSLAWELIIFYYGSNLKGKSTSFESVLDHANAMMLVYHFFSYFFGFFYRMISSYLTRIRYFLSYWRTFFRGVGLSPLMVAIVSKSLKVM